MVRKPKPSAHRDAQYDRVEAEHSLLLATLEATADGILVVDHAGKIVRCNERFVKLWRIPQSVMEGSDDERAIAFVLSQLKDPDAFVQKIRELYADPDAESFDVLEFIDGRVFERYSIPQRAHGKPIGRVWSFRDVTERVRQERERAAAQGYARKRLERLESLWRLLTKPDLSGEELAETILEEGRRALDLDSATLARVSDGTTLTDAAPPQWLGRRNRKLMKLDSSIAARIVALGRTFDSADLNGDFFKKGDVEGAKTPLRALICSPIDVAGRTYVLAFGSRKPRHAPFTHEDREYVELLAAYFGRLLRMHEQEGQITYLAYHDSLTSLENRRGFLERVNEAAARAKRQHRKFAVMYIDLDRFKDVNDTLGHLTGDAVLGEAGRRLRATVRVDDAASRFGGDEFAVLMSELASPTEAEELARRICAVMSEPFTADDRELQISTSIGIAIYPDDGVSAGELLGCADAALYRAKEQGRNRHCFYSQDIAAKLSHRRQLQSGLRNALDRGEFSLVYQPVVRVCDGGIDAVEALLRWTHPQRGTIFPAEFIPVAEDTGLMLPLGQWVIRVATAQMSNWLREGRRWRMAVNISALQLQDPSFLPELTMAIEDARIPPELLELEITESAALRDSDVAQTVVSECRRLGMRVALDDFGTHYASLAHLKKLPVDIIKIDRSFVRGLPNDPNDAAIVRSVIALGENFRCAVVAEGVERFDQFQWLTDNQCALLQGFYIAKPMTREDLEHWLSQRQARASA